MEESGFRNGSQNSSHGRMGKSGHGLPKVSPGPAMPYPSVPCVRPPLKQSPGHFRGGSTAGRTACGHLLAPLDTPRRTPLNGSQNSNNDCKQRRKQQLALRALM
jgi:hypothetical protein